MILSPITADCGGIFSFKSDQIVRRFSMSRLKTVEWVNNSVRIVDQTRLPLDLKFDDISSVEKMYAAIKSLKVRGAPAIGIAAAYGLFLGVRDFPEDKKNTDFFEHLVKNAEYLASSRPTAVNLSWAVERMVQKAKTAKKLKIDEIKAALLEEADNILNEDKIICRKIGENGFEVLKEYSNILTHCNAGGLATSEYGTALAPVYIGKERGKIFHVFADETRPLLQGARITAFELMNAGIPVTLICDNMAAVVMSQGKIDAVVVGADRIASNGDTANKIGTYNVALLAKAHNIPFYITAPISTFDLSKNSGAEIPIEERDGEEVASLFGKRTAPVGVAVFNPAFDVTPYDLITGIITEKGVLFPPLDKAISKTIQ